jgi:hypothetical protein
MDWIESMDPDNSSVVDCVSVGAETCSPSRCLRMDVSSDSTILAFRRLSEYYNIRLCTRSLLHCKGWWLEYMQWNDMIVLGLLYIVVNTLTQTRSYEEGWRMYFLLRGLISFLVGDVNIPHPADGEHVGGNLIFQTGRQQVTDLRSRLHHRGLPHLDTARRISKR